MSFNDQVIAEFRANKGVVSGPGGYFDSIQLLLLHHVGRRSGKQWVTPLMTMAWGDSQLLLGSGRGREAEPAWVANLEAMDKTTIEVGDRTLTVRPMVLRDGPEYTEMYAAFREYWPGVREYEKSTDRPFPVLRLDPILDPSD